jgi:hypothetical protein
MEDQLRAHIDALGRKAVVDQIKGAGGVESPRFPTTLTRAISASFQRDTSPLSSMH